ncbi:MAG: transglycosylase domain-containing protein [Pseudomonadota bacterium]
MTVHAFRILRKGLLALLVVIAAYLCVVAAWSSASFDSAIAGAIAAPPLSQRQTDILLMVEDPAFFRHAGLSVGKGQGFATISSAVARDVYLDGEQFDGANGVLQGLYRTVFNCCKKIDLGRDVMALVLNAKLSKEAQLALFTSHVYMGTHGGEQVRGLGAAADRYLGKPLSATTEKEFIGLVAMIKAPNRYHPLKAPAAHALRAARI